MLTYFLAVSESRFGPVTATTRVVFLAAFFTEITKGFCFALAYLAYQNEASVITFKISSYLVTQHDKEREFGKSKRIQEKLCVLEVGVL